MHHRPRSIRIFILLVTLIAAGRASAVATFLNVPFDSIPGVDPNLLALDVYVPDDADGTNPVMLMFHGGGFVSGDKALEPVVHPKMDYYTDLGWVFVSANYRLTDPLLTAQDPAQVSHPDHIQDVVRAIGWTRQNISAYGGSSDKLLLVGFSAGAQLVALAATDESRLAAEGLLQSDLRGVIALDGLYDIPLRYTQFPPPPPRNLLIWGTDLATWLDMSPAAHVVPGEAVPPMLVVHQDSANNIEQSSEFVTTLLAAGVDAQIFNAVGLTHSEIGVSVGIPGHEMTEVVDDFVAQIGLPEPSLPFALTTGVATLFALGNRTRATRCRPFDATPRSGRPR